VLKNQSTKADSRWHITEKSFDLGILGEIPHDNRWCRSDVRARWFCVPNVVDDCHDRSSRKIPLPDAPLSVFLSVNIWFLGNPAWCEEQSQMEMRFIMVRALGKRVKAVHTVATLVLLVFGEIAITM